MRFFILLKEGAASAFYQLKVHKLRTFLTLASIAFGIFAILFVFFFVDNLEYTITYNLSQIGGEVLYVHKWPWKDNSEDWHKYVKRPQVSFLDYKALKSQLQNISGIAFQATRHGQLIKTLKESATNVSVLGIHGDYTKINPVEVLHGRFFTKAELESDRKVAFLGNWLATELFGSPEKALGATIYIRGKPFTVIGVAEKQGADLFGNTLDDRVLIPYFAFRSLYVIKKRYPDRLITIKVKNSALMDEVEQQVIYILRNHRRLKPGVENNFAINRQEMVIRSIRRVLNVLQMGGLFISIFALLVGGFGITNILFVSVKERTKEIGIMRALGASRRFILFSFLTEAVYLCLFGAVAAIVLTLLLAGATLMVFQWLSLDLMIRLNWSHHLIGLAIAIVLGIASGYLPARAAAYLNPIEAIRTL